MKKIILMVGFFVGIMYLFMPSAEAIMYANGNLNYPIYSHGNRAGSAFDVSSCYFVKNEREEKIVKAINFFMYFNDGDGFRYENGILHPSGYVYFEKIGESEYIRFENGNISRVFENSDESEAITIAIFQAERQARS